MLSYLRKSGILDSKEVKQAFTHKSVNENHYERLEFLGDSVLGVVISEALYRGIKSPDVGVIAKIKGYLVSKEVLFRIAKENHIHEHIILGSALKIRDIENNKKLVSDVVESIIGAVYLLKGFEKAKKFILNIYMDEVKDLTSRKDFGDYKSELQMKLLAKSGHLPEYRVVRTEGKEHNKVFYVDVLANDAVLGSGCGKTIKEAEQMAAQKAIGQPIKEGTK